MIRPNNVIAKNNPNFIGLLQKEKEARIIYTKQMIKVSHSKGAAFTNSNWHPDSQLSVPRIVIYINNQSS